MNKIRTNFSVLVRAVFGLLVFACLTGCKEREDFVRKYTVTVQESLFFTTDNYTAEVEEGDSFSTILRYEYGYTFAGCNATDYFISESEEGVRLTVKNVLSDMRIIVTSVQVFEEAEATVNDFEVIYHSNGGIWEDTGNTQGVPSDESRIMYYSVMGLRYNTSLGKELSREGFALLGWNTEADGKGFHVGLGSRSEYTELFAEWVPWQDEADFVVKRVKDGVALTGYRGKGNQEYFVIPETIEGRTVVQIDASFTVNMPCGTIESKKLVLPDTIKTIASGAFKNANFSEIYFYDNIESVEDSAFSKPLSTYHINAASEPIFVGTNDNAAFADKMDRLMTANGRKMVLFGGCATSYGIKSDLLSEEFKDYSICNMGVIGGVNAIFQMDIIGEYLEEGDLFLHLPEEMSQFQLMTYSSLDYRMFIMVEGNYDLLSLADLSYAGAFWEAFKSYSDIRLEQSEVSDRRKNNNYNKYGDIALYRPYMEENYWEQDTSLSDFGYRFDTEVLSEAGIARLCAYYDAFRQKGVTVLTGYAPVNLDGLEDADSAQVFDNEFRRLLAERGYEPMGNIEDHLFRGRFFFDSDYHLNDMGAILQTKKLIEEMHAKGVK